MTHLFTVKQSYQVGDKHLYISANLIEVHVLVFDF